MSTPQVSRALETRVDVNGNAGIAQLGAAGWDDAEVINSSMSWGTFNQDAATAHWVIWRNYEFYKNQFGLNGSNGQGNIARVLVGVPESNAYWREGDRLITLGVSPTTGRSLATVDIASHEYGHGLSRQLIGGGFQDVGESGTLDEGFSDIFGAIMERQLLPASWDWTIGEDSWLLRNMANPTNFQQPQVYMGPYWSYDYSPRHQNNGVLNKWFYTLCTGQGPNGNTISPINFDDAAKIVYWALDYYLQTSSGYADARDATMTAACNLWGGCSPQQRAVMAAWRAVNLDYNDNRSCDPDCNFLTSMNSISTGCNQAITLNANCNGGSGISCLNVLYSFSGPNVPYNMGGSSINIVTPATGGNYQYSVSLNKPGCYVPTSTFTINTNCPVQNSCDFSNGPRYVGTWNGLTVQIRQISGHNVLVTAIPNSSTDKYYPRGDNFWGNFSLDPGAAGLQSCLNAGSTGYGGLVIPGGLTPPSGYYQGQESDGAIFFSQNGSNPVNPCDVSPRHVGTWNGLNVEIRTFANGQHALVTAIPGSSNDKYYVRGNNFWDNFTKDSGADQYQPCLNVGNTDWWGLTKPGSVSPPPGYQQGTSSDGAVYFSTNGLRVGVPEPTVERVALSVIHPNPAQDEVTVTFLLKEAGNVPVRLLDLQGRVQQQHTYKGVAGKNERTLTISSLATGIYALEVIFDGQRVIHKLVKE